MISKTPGYDRARISPRRGEDALFLSFLDQKKPISLVKPVKLDVVIGLF